MTLLSRVTDSSYQELLKRLIQHLNANPTLDTDVIDAWFELQKISEQNRASLRMIVQDMLNKLSLLLIRPVKGITDNPEYVFFHLPDQDKMFLIQETVKVMGTLIGILNDSEHYVPPQTAPQGTKADTRGLLAGGADPQADVAKGGGGSKKEDKKHRRFKGGFQEMDVAKIYNAQGLVTNLDTSLSQHLITNPNVYPNPFSAGGLTQSSEGIDANLSNNIKADIVPSYNGGNKKSSRK